MRPLRRCDAARLAFLRVGAGALFALVAACSGNVDVDGTGGGANGGSGGDGAEGGAGGAGNTGTGGDGGTGGGVPGPYEAFCDAKASCNGGQGASFDYDLCVGSATCDSVLLHHPGGELFACLSEGTCSFDGCLPDLYFDYSSSDHTPAAQAFQDGCVAAIEAGCPVFEDFCLAGALFTDEALVTMTGCFDLPSCDELRACALSTYAPCTGWVYQLEP